MTIADRIRNRRLELGLTVDDLAELLNKNRATVYRYESNYIKTQSPDVISALAAALHTTPAYFYGYDDKPPEHVINETASSTEARIISAGIDKMPEERRQQALAIMKVAFAEYADYFKEENGNET